jgi:hypothetical protein
VLAGETVTDPLAGCAPMLLSMVTLSAFDEVQLKVVLLPWAMLAGFAVRERVGGNTTLTLVLPVAVPAGPLAVAV